jgi:transposase
MRWTKEEKLKMVLEYKKNGFTPSVEGCCRKTMYDHIRIWARVYDIYGESGLEHRIRHWTYEDKVKAVQRVLDGESYHEVAHSLGISNKTLITTWHRKYLEFGCDGLKLDGRGRKRKMGNKPIKPSKSKSQAEEIVELRKKLEYLEAENAYLKKLAALVQKRKAQEQKKK